eukprot:1160580-Pelagomonas_calceolata.AAC.11
MHHWDPETCMHMLTLEWERIASGPTVPARLRMQGLQRPHGLCPRTRAATPSLLGSLFKGYNVPMAYFLAQGRQGLHILILCSRAAMSPWLSSSHEGGKLGAPLHVSSSKPQKRAILISALIGVDACACPVRFSMCTPPA